jgi:hypothetical protein
MELQERFVARPFAKGWRGLRGRLLILLLVFGAGLLAFQLGAGASDRGSIAEATIFTKIYYALGLFVLGGLDLGTPSGGPGYARTLLWIAYFAAPAVTASALIETLLYLVQPQVWVMRRLRGHVVVGGCGQLSLLFLRRLRAEQPRVPIVVVEPREDQIGLEEAVDVHRAHVLQGDITNGELLTHLRLDRAQRVVLLTGDDFVNLEAAAKIKTIAPKLSPRSIAHVSDLRFLRAIVDKPVHAETFNTHQIAASHLVQTHLLTHFDRTEPRDLVVLAGFGRFGQTVLDELQKKALGKFHTVVIADVEASLGAAVFESQIGFASGYERAVMDRDLSDPLLWRELEEKFDFGAAGPVIVLGCGDGGMNLRTALTISSRYPEATIIARSFHRSVFAEQMSLGSNVRAFSVAELVSQSMPVHWFEAPRG